MSVAFCSSSRLDQDQFVVCKGANIHILHRCSQIRTVTGGLGSFLGLPDIDFLVYFHFFIKVGSGIMMREGVPWALSILLCTDGFPIPIGDNSS